MPELQTTMYAVDGLSWSDASLWQQFETLCEQAPEMTAVIDPSERRWTRAGLHEMALEIRHALQEGGVQQHDRVLIEGRKSAATLAAALAVSSLDAIVCPFAPDLGRAEQQVLEERLNHIALITSRADTGSPLPATTGLRLALRARSQLAPREERDVETALIGFTSGTTGVPKGVMHRASALNYTARACAFIAGIEPNDAIIGVVPLGSAPGYTFTAHFSLALGHPLVMIDPWDPVHALAMMDKYQCRWGICVPTHLLALIEAAKSGKWTKPSPLKALGTGGSTMTPGMVADADALLGLRVLRMFGMSECMGHTSTRLDDPFELRCNSDGKSFPGTEDEAFDPANRMLPRNLRGQAGVRGPSLFLGYCKGMGDQASVLNPAGFYLTGDEVICSADGHVKVVGRIKDQIIRGGYNIDPAEVEAALLRHPAIAKVAVVAVPEARLGEQACAVCCIRDSQAAPDLAKLKDHLAEIGLSKKKWPEHLLIVDDMQYTGTGKIDKKRMAKLAVSQLGLG